MAHVYTRDPAMLDIFGNTGLKFNLSVGYARGPDGKVARIVEPDGSVNPNSSKYEGLRFATDARKKVVADLEALDLVEKIEDRMWAIHEENAELVTRAMEAGNALSRLFENGLASGAITIADMFDTDYVAIPDTNPVQYRTKMLDWADRALPALLEAFLAKDTRLAFCATVERNGYLPVHNKIYSQPQRLGDVGYNTANCRNRRIFNDPAGLAAAHRPSSRNRSSR